MDDKKFSKEDAYQTLNLINSWINNIDVKTSFALAFLAVLVAFTLDKGTPRIFSEIFTTECITCLMVFQLILGFMLYLNSILSIIFMLLAIRARTKRTSIKKSGLFFGAIAQMELNDYKAKTMNMDNKDLIKDLLEQVHTNSTICSKKVKMYNKGIVCLMITMIACFLSIVFNVI